MLRELVIACTGGSSWDQDLHAWVALSHGRMVVNQTAAVHREIGDLLGRAEGMK